MQSLFLSFQSSRIHYLLGGKGDKLLLCFHGYGESAESFAFLEEAVGQEFTILSIDLPFHGKTEWKEGLFFDPAVLVSLIEQMAAGQPGGDKRWWLMGYSMGGRVALHLLEKMPEKVEKLVLLAPDGLKVNGWYWLVTQTTPGNLIFRWTMRRPKWFFTVLRLGNALKLVNRSVYKFTTHYIGHPSIRKELYARWTTMRGFKPDIPMIQTLIRERHIPVRLLYGQHDRIILPERGERFRQGGIEAHCRITLLPVGHQVLQARNLDAIVRLLKE